MSPSGGLLASPSTLDPDHRALAEAARGWLASRCPPEVVRTHLEGPSRLPDFWAELAGMGWIGLAVDAARGGEGAGAAGLAAVVEEWGRAVAPGPFPATALVATLLGRAGGAPAADALRSLLSGTPAALVRRGEGEPVDGAALAELLLVRCDRGDGGDGVGEGGGGAATWALLDAGECRVLPVPAADPGRAIARVEVDDALLRGAVGSSTALELEDSTVDALSTLLAAAESVGVATWCVATAAQWAATREQFGHPIGRFQAVKHRCADSLCRLELARASTWDAARADPAEPGAAAATAAAGALAPAAAFACAQDAIQVLGGTGYTWEHDAHLYLRRAAVLSHLSVPAARRRAEMVAHARAGRRRVMHLELEGVDGLRHRIRGELAELAGRPSSEWNRALADGGWICPHWPEPWGRDAGPVEQVVIDEELAAAGIRRPHLQVAGWVLPTIIAHGTREQQERWVGASLRGEVTWCQLFSEPGAGSDLASLSTRATRVPGGWSLSGQKVWTTMAREAHWGLCLARSDPGAGRHDGITCFAVDMGSTGVDVRPLRELTGFQMFNEVFLEDVFVPDDCVVGEPGRGWHCARTTLENERVSMASGSSFGPGVSALVRLAEDGGLLGDPVVVDRLGSLLVDSHALAVLGLRGTVRAVGAARGSGPTAAGPEASVRKLTGVEHEQAVQEAALELLGSEAVALDGEGGRWFGGFLGNRALSIAGGTSEIQRNVIGERLLGLPRDLPGEP